MLIEPSSTVNTSDTPSELTALPLAIKRAGLIPDQIDVGEVHEAFSAQALGVLRELPSQLGEFSIPDDKRTPNGGAVAIGQPFGAIGTGYVRTLATKLRERNACYGAVGVCVGSGQAVAVILEDPNAPEPHKQYLHIVVR